MNTKNAKKATETQAEEKEVLKLNSWSVERVRVVTTKDGKDLVFLSLILNGITIHNCRVATGRNGDFISFPQYKGSNGQYYNTVFARLSEEDTKAICAKVQEEIDKM